MVKRKDRKPVETDLETDAASFNDLQQQQQQHGQQDQHEEQAHQQEYSQEHQHQQQQQQQPDEQALVAALHHQSHQDEHHFSHVATDSNESNTTTTSESMRTSSVSHENDQIILERTASSLLRVHEELVDASPSTSSSSGGTATAHVPHDSHTHADAPNNVANAITSLESLDSAMASAVAAASNSVHAQAHVHAHAHTHSSISSSTTSSSSVAAVAAIAAEVVLSQATGASSSSSSNAVVTHTATQDSAARYNKCPVMIRWPANDWESWLEQEKVHCRWNLIRCRARDKQTFARGPTASEWTREYQCDHAGQYRDRKNPNIDPSKKRKRAGSIKCNCPAFIKMRKQFHDDEVVIEYSWKHQGHIPDVMEDIKAHRLPQDLKTWIKRRIEEGHDWKSVKGLMTSGSPLLDELHPTTKQNVRLLLPASYAQYANTARQLRNRSGAASPSSSQGKRAKRGGTVIKLGAGDVEMPLAERSSHSSSPHPNAHASSSSGEDPIAHLQHQVLALGEPLLNAEAISNAIREQEGTQQMASLSLVDGTVQVATSSAAANAANNQTAGATANHMNHSAANAEAAEAANILYQHNAHESMQGTTHTENRPEGASQGQQQQQSQEQQREQQQQQPRPQPQQARAPRDMMIQMLRAIADLHKQMEATEEYGTQEDAIQIIESFALPIRLMKEALEKRSSTRH
ncbi:hypothetical protein BGZ51_004484 [Haplosporangium sp. Z 767]|nr:hypothetical protein BGZ51_004484 [Haplosporangium sp. Z 767]KAF9185586.1 hypothetical protein BGZ50_002986 [Haplosporangium sp. Z 11]